MKNILKALKCDECGKVLERLYCTGKKNCEVTCCGKKMHLLEANISDASKEKHTPVYEICDDEIIVRVPHVMEKEHFIEWIALVKENKKIIVELYPEQECIVHFPYLKDSTIYSYCNKHGLWSCDVN